MIEEAVHGADLPPEQLGPCIRFPELLDHLDAIFRRICSWTGKKEQILRPFSESHVFFLGEEEKIDKAIDDIWKDLREEVRSRILMPFKDITVVFKQTTAFRIGECWTAVRLVEDPTLGGDGQPLMVFMYTIKNLGVRVPPRLWSFWYRGSEPKDAGETYDASMSEIIMIDIDGAAYEPVIDSSVRQETFSNTGHILRAVAAISHPANYVVRVQPRLTAREERQTKEGRPNPAKKPHFIVVDHEVLAGMTGSKPIGTHASPVPHHRRGHWRRLADHCTKARLLGDRVPVRPSYVGKREFADEKNFYQVLLDFSAPNESGIK